MKRYTVKMLFLVCIGLAFPGLVATMAVSPARVEGKEMPGVIVIKSLRNQYRPVTFNHEMHAAIAGNCGTCHHQHPEKARATCQECHNTDVLKSTVKQSFSACSSCHSDPSPEMPEMPGLKVALHKTCFQCHVGIGDLGSSPKACAKTCHAKR